ncbi:MAG: tRNA-uridine aminocarboxypropyltransferase [Plesiomonas sp.]|uniref:tRNA-uridine aminocarboxypropyltransferase n=1 Tax=Plesiomonas sp. TaxID=2486279 RepID=UPI003F40DF07
MLPNAVLTLREARLAHSTRPFLARGCRVVRCQRCLLAVSHCLCAHIQPVSANSQFCLIMYDTEPLKPSNTGRLIADILPDTQAFLWSRTEINPALLALLQDPTLQPYIIFPESYAAPERVVHDLLTSTPNPLTPPNPAVTLRPFATKPLFIMLDGTWTEARKMFRKSPYLDQFPVLPLRPTSQSEYQLREASTDEQLCTAEVAAQLLLMANDQQAAQALDTLFVRFKQHYLAGKFNRRIDSITATTER